tara:strand:+ start:818 stop:982 length:165 start_codon:yes stop_codon:yes gene_type:complete
MKPKFKQGDLVSNNLNVCGLVLESVATEYGIFYSVLISGKILSFIEEDLIKKDI